MPLNLPGMPGTLAHAAIEHLRTLRPGAELTSVEMWGGCGRIGVANSIATKLRKAVAAGLIVRSRDEEARCLRWSLPLEGDADSVRQIKASAASAPRVRTTGVPSVFQLAERGA